MADGSDEGLMRRELRELRTFRRLSARSVDQALGWRANKATEMERDAKLRFEDLRAYVALFGLSLGDFEECLAARRAYESHPIHSRLLAEGLNE